MNRLLLVPALLLAAPAAAQPATPYKALGTEPFWSLSIDARTMTYRPMEGRAVTVAKPRPIVGINGELYRARGMTVDVTHVRCSDVMSDRMFADTVKVTIGRRTLSGCGGAIVTSRLDSSHASILANTQWRIDLIDGRPVRLREPATVRFTRDRIEGKVCNSYGGAYTLRNGRLTTDRVMSTKMYCAGGVSDVENAFLRLIAQPVSVSQAGRDMLRLTAGKSSVTLRRIP